MNRISSVLVVCLILFVTLTVGAPIAGIDSLGVGFDLLSGKSKLPAVSYSYNDETKWFNPYTSETSEVPDQVGKIAISAQAALGTQVYLTAAEYAAGVAQVADGVEYSQWKGAAFANDEAVIKARMVFAGGEKVLVEVKEVMQLYEILLLPWQTNMLQPSRSLSAMVESLPSHYSKAEYRELVSQFGTHFVAKVILGGQAQLVTAVGAGMYFQAGGEAVLKAAGAQFKNLTASGGIAGIEAGEEYFNFTEVVQVGLFTQGGFFERFVEPSSNHATNPLKAESSELRVLGSPFSRWMESVKRIPAPIRRSLVPLSSLITDPVKKDLIDRAIQDYVADTLSGMMSSH